MRSSHIPIEPCLPAAAHAQPPETPKRIAAKFILALRQDGVVVRRHRTLAGGALALALQFSASRRSVYIARNASAEDVIRALKICQQTFADWEQADDVDRSRYVWPGDLETSSDR